MLQWKEMSYREFPLSVRLHCLEEKLTEIKGNLLLHRGKFKLAKYYDCSNENFLSSYYGPVLRPYLVKNSENKYTLDWNVIPIDIYDNTSTLWRQYSMILNLVEDHLR